MGIETMDDLRRSQVRAFIDGLQNGGFPDDLFTPDVAFWTTVSGPVAPASYRQVPRILKAIFGQRIQFTIDSLILEGDRAAAEVRSEGLYDEGERYANSYAFLFRFAGARISTVAEHFNPLHVSPALTERMLALMAG